MSDISDKSDKSDKINWDKLG